MKITFKNDDFWKGSLKYYFLSFSWKDTDILNIDRQGRVISFIKDNGTKYKTTYKKGFDGNWLGIKRPRSSGERIRYNLDQNEISELYDYIQAFCVLLINHLSNLKALRISYDDQDCYKDQSFNEVVLFWKNLLQEVTYKQNRSDSLLFPNIYTSIGILPPDRYGSLILQVTSGCVYNKCAFCHLYQGIEYKYKTENDLQLHLDKVSKFMGESIGRFHSIFLGDANALTIPFKDLVTAFDLINNVYQFSDKKVSHIQKTKPIFEGIYSFLDVFTGFKLSKEHFSKLAQRNLKMVYLGVESGSERVLKLLQKPNTIDKVVSVVDALHGANVGVAVIILIGAGGKTLEQDHLQESLSLIKKLSLRSKDIIFLSKLYIYEDSLLEINMKKKNIIRLTNDELEDEYRYFKRMLEDHYSKQSQFDEFVSYPHIAKYEIAEFIY